MYDQALEWAIFVSQAIRKYLHPLDMLRSDRTSMFLLDMEYISGLVWLKVTKGCDAMGGRTQLASCGLLTAVHAAEAGRISFMVNCWCL